MIEAAKLGDVRQGIKKADPKRAEHMRDVKDRKLAEAELRVEGLHEELDAREDLVFYEDFTGAGREQLGLQLAHQLFLYGTPARKVPIRNLTTLARYSRIPKPVLERHAVAWAKESMRLAREATPLYKFACSPEAHANHSKDLDNMRTRIDALQEKLDSGDLEVGEKAYNDTTRLLIAARKEWQDASGVGAGIKVSEAAAKIEAKSLMDAHLRLEAEMSDEDGVSRSSSNGGLNASPVEAKVFNLD